MKVRMEFVNKAMDACKIKHVRELWRILQQRGLNISTNGVRNYVKEDTQSMRIDFLMALQELCAEAGVSLQTFWGWVKKDVNKMT